MVFQILQGVSQLPPSFTHKAFQHLELAPSSPVSLPTNPPYTSICQPPELLGSLTNHTP